MASCSWRGEGRLDSSGAKDRCIRSRDKTQNRRSSNPSRSECRDDRGLRANRVPHRATHFFRRANHVPLSFGLQRKWPQAPEPQKANKPSQRGSCFDVAYCRSKLIFRCSTQFFNLAQILPRAKGCLRSAYDHSNYDTSPFVGYS